MLYVQKYLLTHSLNDLEKEYSIYSRFAAKGNKFTLNYDQIFAKNNCSLTKQCRGLILRADHKNPEMVCGKTEIVAYPFDRFFNFGQAEADIIDLKDMYDLFLKVDGTLCICYWDNVDNAWHIGTRSISEADVPLNDNKLTFRMLFEKAIQEYLGVSFNDFTKQLIKSFTYCFELCSQYNQVVVKHEECKVFFLGARNLETLKEYYVTDFHIHDLFPKMRVERYQINDNYEEILNFINSKNGYEFEGCVLVQEDDYKSNSFKRLKIKNKDYCFLNKQTDILSSSRNRVQFCLNEAYDDNIVHVSSRFKEEIETLREQVIAFCKKNDERFEEIKNIKEQRAFAFAMKEGDFSSCFYELRKLDRKNIHMNTFNWILSRKKDGEVPTQIIDQILKRIEK